MKKKSSEKVSFKQGTQVIITGAWSKPLKEVEKLWDATQGNLFVDKFCSKHGEIGYLGQLKTSCTFLEFKTWLVKVTKQVDSLSLGVTVMSDKPGQYTSPVLSFIANKGRVVITAMPHLGHPAPKKIEE